MILWTVVPVESVLEGYEQEPRYEEVSIAGVDLVVERMNDAQCRVVRLLSTNPDDYLEPGFQPGSVLTYRAGF